MSVEDLSLGRNGWIYAIAEENMGSERKTEMGIKKSCCGPRSDSN